VSVCVCVHIYMSVEGIFIVIVDENKLCEGLGLGAIYMETYRHIDIDI